MAKVYPYPYKGQMRTKQDKCRPSMPLDKARIWLDFNELVAVDESSGDPIYLFSQADIVNDSEGEDIELYDGLEVSVFDDDFDLENRPDALLAEGIILKNECAQYPQVKWAIQLSKGKPQNGNRYVYWMSDLTGRADAGQTP